MDELDQLVAEFCTAVGEPHPVDAIMAARRQREALEYIVARGYTGAEWVAQKALKGEDWR